MQKLISDTQGKALGPLNNGKYFIFKHGEILVPDIPVGSLFERPDGTVIHIIKCWFLKDTYDINIAKGDSLEKKEDVPGAALLNKLIIENWKVA
jgi:hypothetical protein